MSDLKTNMILVLAMLCSACGPKIIAFEVSPLAISPKDSIKINWEAKGKATIMINDQYVGQDTIYREIILRVAKNGKELARHQDVRVVQEGALDAVVFKAHFQGDTLVGGGPNNPAKWGSGFVVGTVTNTSSRPLIIQHDQKTVVLDTRATASNGFYGTTVSSYWELRSPLSAAERADSTHLPAKLSIMITIKKQ